MHPHNGNVRQTVIMFPADWGDSHFIGVVRVLDRICRALDLRMLTVALIIAAASSMPVDAAPVPAVDSKGRSYFPQDATKAIPECKYSWTKEPLRQVEVSMSRISFGSR